METQIQSIHFKADKKLIGFIHEKLEKLEHFHKNITSAEVFLKIDKDKGNENKVVEIKLHIPGIECFVKKNAETFEEATDVSIDALRKQLIKDKEK